MDLRELSDEALFNHVTELVGSQRELTAKLVAYLAEIEARRLHLLAGYSSMFDFCTKSLRLGEGEAFRRILAARLGRRFPVVYPLLASGALNLSTLELLREWLNEENHEELFAAVANKSKLEVQAFLAARFPRPDRPSRIRRTTIEPLSEGRLAIEFTASAELREKLELCRDLMSHANPSRDLAVVIERAVVLLLADLERRRLARTKRPRHPREAGKEDDPASPTRRDAPFSNATDFSARTWQTTVAAVSLEHFSSSITPNRNPSEALTMLGICGCGAELTINSGQNNALVANRSNGAATFARKSG